LQPVILCVDDDPLVRDVTQVVLERGGYRVLQAASGAEAISVLSESQEPISLVVLDWMVRDLPGAEVVTRLKTLRPELKILLTSGYDRSTVMRRAPKRAIHDFLAKPYLPKELVQSVAQALRSVRAPRLVSGKAT
jgi:CheY-like chemotaxis protein